MPSKPSAPRKKSILELSAKGLTEAAQLVKDRPKCFSHSQPDRKVHDGL
jgi:hypothetical protein